jgi:hypothetical protein
MAEVKVPGIETLGILLAKASAKWAFQKASSAGIKGLKEWIIAEANNDGSPLNQADLKTLDGLLGATNVFYKSLVSAAKPWTDAGAVLVGPSGGGKSTIASFLSTGKLAEVSEDAGGTTTQVHSEKIRYHAAKYVITDTAGQHESIELKADVAEALRLGKERVLVLVMSGGFLKTRGIVDADGSEIPLKRPQRDAAPDLDSYLQGCADEEIEWLKSMAKGVGKLPPKRTFRYILVVVNKADQWWDFREHVAKYYKGMLNVSDVIPAGVTHLTADRSNRLKEALGAVTANWGVIDANPSFHLVSSDYNSVYDRPPSGGMSRGASMLSMALLRAELRLRFREI